jgi:rubrerythrin
MTGGDVMIKHNDYTDEYELVCDFCGDNESFFELKDLKDFAKNNWGKTWVGKTECDTCPICTEENK